MFPRNIYFSLCALLVSGLGLSAADQNVQLKHVDVTELRAALYIAERVYFSSVDTEIQGYFPNDAKYSWMESILGYLDRMQKGDIEADFTDKAETFLQTFLQDLGCVFKLECSPFERKHKRISFMRELIDLIAPKVPSKTLAAYRNLFTCEDGSFVIGRATPQQFTLLSVGKVYAQYRLFGTKEKASEDLYESLLQMELEKIKA